MFYYHKYIQAIIFRTNSKWNGLSSISKKGHTLQFLYLLVFKTNFNFSVFLIDNFVCRGHTCFQFFHNLFKHDVFMFLSSERTFSKFNPQHSKLKQILIEYFLILFEKSLMWQENWKIKVVSNIIFWNRIGMLLLLENVDSFQYFHEFVMKHV